MNGVTIRQVAEEAGVSVATVSRALRGLPMVAPATRELVQAAARKLNYVPDPYASMLSAKRVHTIIVAVPFPGQWYYAQIIASVEAVASAEGSDIRLHVVADDNQRRRFLEETLPAQRRVDGAIVVDIPMTNEDVERIRRSALPIVGVGQHVEGIVTVGIDNVRAAYDATEYLIGLGHRCIGVLGGMPDGSVHLSIPGERELGYRRAIEGAGIDFDPDLVANGNFSVQGGVDATRELLRRPDPPTAIFALSDEMGAGAMQASREAGVSVPGDLSIMGFDDHSFSVTMGLSTIRQPVEEQGEEATRALLDAVEGRPWAKDVVLAHRLIERATTSRVGTAPRADTTDR
jgi:LacI family repressor for deo operon, udp, cdd, tsx, nupC, and nupG